MKKQIRKPTLYIRTAYWGDKLRLRTRLGYGRLWQQVDENQYKPYGLKGPTADTVRDYLRACRSPGIDPQDGLTPAWLLAAELEFKGSSFDFFHPLFDLLFGQLESSAKWLTRMQMIPDSWIAKAKQKGRMADAEEWEQFNASLRAGAGRRPIAKPIDRLGFIHLTLMRLPEPIFSMLFERRGLAITHARAYMPIEEEVELLGRLHNMEGLAALVGLALEAAEIGDMKRFHHAHDAVQRSVQIVSSLKECSKVSQLLQDYILLFCTEVPSRRYHKTLHYGFGLPATWRARKDSELMVRTAAEFDELIKRSSR